MFEDRLVDIFRRSVTIVPDSPVDWLIEVDNTLTAVVISEFVPAYSVVVITLDKSITVCIVICYALKSHQPCK